MPIRMPRAALRRALGRFARDDRGSIVAEAVIVLPMLVWAYLGLFVYWDVFRSYNAVQKAAYSISDFLSRQQAVDRPMLDGMQGLMNYVLDRDQEAAMRITSVQWVEAQNRYYVLWSHSPERRMLPWTNRSVSQIAGRIPDMANGQSVIIVEVEVGYRPAFDAGLSDQTFRQFIVTRPRFMTRVCMTSGCPIPAAI